MDRLEPWFAWYSGIREDRLDLGREHDTVSVRVPVERLLPEPISREHQLALIAIPDGDREHAAQVVNEVHALVFVEVDEHLGIRLGAKTVSSRQQAVTQLPIVVDFAVERDPDPAVLVRERLLSGRQTDDAEAAVTETDLWLDVTAFLVRSTVGEECLHRLESAAVDSLVLMETIDSADSAHPLILRRRSSRERALSRGETRRA